MDEIIIAEQQETSPGVLLATVAAVTANGVRIQIDGEDAAGDKEYRCNTAQAFAVGDRVKFTPISGSYVIDYKIGAPGETYPIPSGGSDGQVLTKDGADPYKVKWGTATHGIPSGGNSGQVLAKASGSNYDVEWVSKGLPSGGTSGQVLAKTSASDYAVAWTTVLTVPSTGTTGHVLTKTATGCEWAAAPSPSVSSLVNGNYTLSLSNAGVLAASASNRKIQLGTSSIPFNTCYIGGELYLGTSSSDKIGFFGHAVASRQTVSNTATVATLITALKAYGLIA